MPVLLILLAGGWYLYPYILWKYLQYETDSEAMDQYYSIRPALIETLTDPPANWKEIDIAGLVIRLPLDDCAFIKGDKTHLYLNFGYGRVVVSGFSRSDGVENALKTGSMESFKTTVQSLNALPADISLLNSRQSNMDALTRLTLKTISAPSIGCQDINIVDQDSLKAVCLKSFSEKHTHSVSIMIFSTQKKETILVTLKHYPDSNTLNDHMLKVLGSIRISDHAFDPEKAEKDVYKIIKGLKKK